MHILLIHQAFAALSEPGGTRHHEISRYLVAQGHRVTILAGQVSYLTGERVAKGWVQREIDDLGVDIRRCYAYSAWHRSFAHRLLSFFSFMVSSFFVGLRVPEVDLVWGTSPPIFQGLTAKVLSYLKKTSFLFEVRDLWPYFAVAVGVLRNRSLIRLSEWLEGLLYRSADCVVVNSPGYIDHVRSRGARTVHLIPNGVDLSMFDPAEDGGNFRRKYDLEDEFMMLYAGAHGISNDLGVVLEAAQLLRDHSDIAIVFLGNGKEKSTLMAKAEALELNNVRFIPSLPKIEMPIALAAADGCIAILKPIEAYKTTFPNKVFDYMAAGRPVVLAVDGVIRDVVEQAGAGVFVPPGDPKAMAEAIKRMADDRDTSAEMGRKGRAYVAENFDRLALSGSMMQVMEGLLGDRHSS